MLKDQSSQFQVQSKSNLSAMDVDLTKVTSPALSRIIEEVRNGDTSTTRAFDRVHNRHNR